MRAIDADAIQYTHAIARSLDDGHNWNELCVTQDEIEDMPTIQPERIKGHWVNGRCDKCNEHAPFWAMASTYYASNFCPNCGADMREVTDGNNN